jgi:hypothetical protein
MIVMTPLTLLRKTNLVVLVVGLGAVSVCGQTRAEIEAKARERIDAYSVWDSIWMTPEYAADGQVCRLRFYPKQFSGNTNFLGRKELSFDEFRKVFDVIVPVGSRGAKKEPFESGWNLGGGVMWATFEYERLTITYSLGVRIDAEALRKSQAVELDLPFSANKDVKEAEVDKRIDADDFSNFHQSRAEIVTVIWKNRTCDKPEP